MKSGLCPEDCGYCSQRRGSDSDILKYNWISEQDAAAAADRAVAGGAKRVCLVASGRGPTSGTLIGSPRRLQRSRPDTRTSEICTSLGLLGGRQADRLREAGVYAYNHNLNTPRSRYEDICTTHTYDDRVATVGRAAGSGLSPCSGAIFGMGESDTEIVDLALDLRKVNPDSVPINFQFPSKGRRSVESGNSAHSGACASWRSFDSCFPTSKYGLPVAERSTFGPFSPWRSIWRTRYSWATTSRVRVRLARKTFR